jgi:hypothetical protein
MSWILEFLESLEMMILALYYHNFVTLIINVPVHFEFPSKSQITTINENFLSFWYILNISDICDSDTTPTSLPSFLSNIHIFGV